MFLWDPNPDFFTLPVLHLPIKWYGFLFSLGFLLSFPVFKKLLLKTLQKNDSALAAEITDKLTLYVVLGTIIGARVGHFLFYEHPISYLSHPLKLLWIREGGLASHGGAIGILIALWFFSNNRKILIYKLSWLRTLDLLAPCTGLVAACIRLGNFINQEVIGTPSSLPWAVIFVHAQDGSSPIPRHPVQLYESFFYLVLFLFLWQIAIRSKILYKEGLLIGLFLVLCFGFRFLIEFIKQEQSVLLLNQPLPFTMGQWLSVPFIALGFFLIFFSLKRKNPIMNLGEKL